MELLFFLKLHTKSIILVTVLDSTLSASNQCHAELFVPVVIGQFLSSLERINSHSQVVTGLLLFSALLMQKFAIVIYKAGSPSVFQQFKAQILRVIAVLLHSAVFRFHSVLLVAAVIGEMPDPYGIPFFYYTALFVICKLLSSATALFSNKLIQVALLVILISR